MANTFYAQSGDPAPTMTVGKLIERLQAYDPNEPVIFRSPLYGCFGSNTAYSIDTVQRVALAREEHHTPAETVTDEETGREVQREAETQIFHPWAGVVIG